MTTKEKILEVYKGFNNSRAKQGKRWAEKEAFKHAIPSTVLTGKKYYAVSPVKNFVLDTTLSSEWEKFLKEESDKVSKED